MSKTTSAFKYICRSTFFVQVVGGAKSKDNPKGRIKCQRLARHEGDHEYGGVHFAVRWTGEAKGLGLQKRG